MLASLFWRRKEPKEVAADSNVLFNRIKFLHELEKTFISISCMSKRSSDQLFKSLVCLS